MPREGVDCMRICKRYLSRRNGLRVGDKTTDSKEQEVAQISYHESVNQRSTPCVADY